MAITIGLDPGSERSALVVYETRKYPEDPYPGRVLYAEYCDNKTMREVVWKQACIHGSADAKFGVEISVVRGQSYPDHIWSYRWGARFLELWNAAASAPDGSDAPPESGELVLVEHVRKFFVGKRAASDAQVRAAVLAFFGQDPKKRKFSEETGLNSIVGSHLVDALAIAMYLAHYKESFEEDPPRPWPL